MAISCLGGERWAGERKESPEEIAALKILP